MKIRWPSVFLHAGLVLGAAIALFPMLWMVSASLMPAGEASTSPLSMTRPSAIIASASRREAIPARAITFAMRSSAGSTSPRSRPSSGLGPAPPWRFMLLSVMAA